MRRLYWSCKVWWYRILRAISPEVFAAELASSLRNQSIMLSKHEQLKEATNNLKRVVLEAITKADDMYRALYQVQSKRRLYKVKVWSCRILCAIWPKVFAAELASSLDNLTDKFSDLGRREEALEATQNVVNLYRALNKAQPETFAARLALRLLKLGISLRGLGRTEEALKPTQEAVAIYLELYRKQKNVAVILAFSLSTLSDIACDLDRSEALATLQEVVSLSRDLCRQQPDVFTSELNFSLVMLSNTLIKHEQLEEALKYALESVDQHRDFCGKKPESEAMVRDLSRSLRKTSTIFFKLGRTEEALNATKESVHLLRPLFKGMFNESNEVVLAEGLKDLGYILCKLGRHKEAKAAYNRACVWLVGKNALSATSYFGTYSWVEFFSEMASYLDSAASLRKIHLPALKSIPDRRRWSDQSSAAGSEFLKLQAVLVANLWKKVAEASNADPQLMDDTLAALVSSLQSPDLMRWLADNRRETPEGLALAEAEYEMRRAQDTLTALLKRLQGGPGDMEFPTGPLGRARTAEQEAADDKAVQDATEKEAASRVALENAQKALAAVDPAFKSAYEVPSVSDLNAILSNLRVATAEQNAAQTGPAALLCFLELPAAGGEDARLVGVLLSSGSTQLQQIEFPGLLELAHKFEQYKPLGQRGNATLRRLRHDSEVGAKQSDQTTLLNFDALLSELEQRWWSPLKESLGEELNKLAVLHICSHGIAHQLPYSQISHLAPGGNVQLFQWPGLPFLRLAYSNASEKTASTESSAIKGWQIAHDCAWDSSPLPMVAVEAHLLLGIIKDAGQQGAAIDDPKQVAPGTRGLAVCSHGSKAQGVKSAVLLPKGPLTTGDVMREKLNPEIALIPACHAADTQDDHAHNALGVAAGFLLAGSKVVVGSTKAVPDTLMPFFSTLLVWYIENQKLGLHAAAVRARQDFGAGNFPDKFKVWIRNNLANALATLHPGAQEERRRNGVLPVEALEKTLSAWPWHGMNGDTLVPTDRDMRAAAQWVASNAFEPKKNDPKEAAKIAAQMRDMAAFLVVFGLG